MRALAAFLLALVLAGCSELRAAKLAAPATFGLEEVAPGLFVEPGTDAQRREQLREDVERARQAVRAAYGSVVSHPSVHACITEACYRRFGGSGSIARVNGDFMLLSPRGLDWHFIAHEWSHDEIRHRLRFAAWWRLPRWFDEGLAVAISEAPEHSEEHWQWLAEHQVPRPTPEELRSLRSLRQWLDAVRRYGEMGNMERKARGEPEIRPVYAAAGHEVRPWLQRLRAAGLQAFIERLNAGEDFDSAYAAMGAS